MPAPSSWTDAHAVVRHVRDTDELQRRIELEAVSKVFVGRRDQ